MHSYYTTTRGTFNGFRDSLLNQALDKSFNQNDATIQQLTP